jgi:hypothetical protein
MPHEVKKITTSSQIDPARNILLIGFTFIFPPAKAPLRAFPTLTHQEEVKRSVVLIHACCA